MTSAVGQLGVSQPLQSARRGWRRVSDRVAESDPGLNRLRTALAAALAVGLAIAAEYLFVRESGALRGGIPPGAPLGVAARVDAISHVFLITAVVLGAIVATVAAVAAVAVTDATPRGQLITLLWFPLPLIGGLAAGLGSTSGACPAWRSSWSSSSSAPAFAVTVRAGCWRGWCSSLAT